MSSKILLRILKSNGSRLSMWYAVFFVLGSASLLFVTYFFLSSALQSKDRESVQAELAELVSAYNTEGLQAVDREVFRNYRFRKKNPFFIRVVENSNQTLKIYYSHIWDEFDLKQLNKLVLRQDVIWVSLPAIGDDFELAATAMQLHDGRWLQVGISSEERKATLHRFRATLTMALLPLTLLGIIGGSLLAMRSLRPVRHIVQTVQYILSGRMEARVIRTQAGDELDDLARLFNEMLDKIRALIDSFKESLDNVAHDLRTPMTRLRSVAEKALQESTDLKQSQDALSDCIEESDRILSMLTMLMDISEAETGALKLHRRLLNISSLIARVVDMYEPVAEEKQVRLIVKAPAELNIKCDGNRLSQALANILDNAVKYSPAGGRVTINVFQDKGELCIQINDTGPGIPSEDLPKIWDRLFRSDTARTQKGLGLGLSFVKAICEAHKGRVSAKSEKGKGSIFCITLPVDY